MPLHQKITYQPKDARAVSIYQQDDILDDEMDDLFSHTSSSNKKIMTGTQALVEFLKTTSPEEFQKTSIIEKTNNGSHNIFSRISRKNKKVVSSSAMSTTSSASITSKSSLPTTLSTIPTSYHGSEHTIHRKNYIEIVPQQEKEKQTTSTSIQSFVSRNNPSGEPILPNKKRESSLYSGSLKHSISIKSQLVNNNNTTNHAVKNEDMDLIESALLQRLDRLKLLNHEIPSNEIATGLAKEHILALGITHSLDNQHYQYNNKSNVRHMQVQTEPAMDTVTATEDNNRTKEDGDSDDTRAKRAEAALENALDHFEVISGLAYKKLREIWEEKMRWENACMDLRDRLLLLEQKKSPFQSEDIIKEEQDEMGLSEFPMSE